MAAPRILAALALFAGLQSADAVPRSPPSTHTFDYVIVGAGAGGLTVASRLSENSSVSVAVVEAGTWSTSVTGNQSQVPADDFYYNGKAHNDTNPLVDWGFITTPQAGINNEAVHYTRGKSLGGCTNLNYMGYTQTTAGALQLWADTVGDPSYAYDQSSKYYRKSLNFTTANTELRLANATTQEEHGTIVTGGLLDVSYSTWAQSFSTWIAKAMDSVGILSTDAFINGRLNGSTWLTSTLNPTNGHRESSATAFLEPVKGRSNLKVFDNTLGERIIFDRNKVATGVQVTTANKTYTLHARREVIVSGGAFQSPQLLQVSGVGPADLLKKNNIPVVADRPGVGQNMSDHVFFGIAYRVNVQTASALTYGDAEAVAQAEFNANGTGPLASPGGDFAGYEKLPEDIRSTFHPDTLKELAELPDDWPEMQYLTLPTFVGDFQSASAGAPQDGYMYATLLATLIAPSSVGTISISSSKMSDHPLINPNWMTTQRDVDLIIGGFKRLRQILEAPNMKGVTIGPEYYPGSKVQTDDEIHSQIQTSFNTMYHAAASCRMGKASDPYAVVDNHARVYGVKNLRVVDISAFPLLPPGLPQATVYMFAEKIADDIKNGN
ncbi:GMC oxidoreductase [Penicillium hispanicum]|uniref:GMC oxidoreductase n=1 Tax=Penicillium hispanicum TaxID=1080232 RepID=UPI00253FCB53|nr:GMC oxidoreductase [Penicillium hispanicum]KAJ5578597.1 GMC oxidoreductase [Penicillium hispanicum]